MEYNQAKSRTKLPCQCNGCQKTFYVSKREITRALLDTKKNRSSFCSRICCNNNHVNKGKPPKQNVRCLQCNTPFLKYQGQIKRQSKHFCSHSCNAKYHNSHKTVGTRRSKLEKWIETQLTILYPTLQVDYNKTSAINAELDIYIPSLKLAFELNGIFHYEPIYGENKLSKIQTNDKNKFELCHSRQISLCVIDTSQQKYVKEKTSRKYLIIITNIIDAQLEKLDRTGIEPVVQSALPMS